MQVFHTTIIKESKSKKRRCSSNDFTTANRTTEQRHLPVEVEFKLKLKPSPLPSSFARKAMTFNSLLFKVVSLQTYLAVKWQISLWQIELRIT